MSAAHPLFGNVGFTDVFKGSPRELESELVVAQRGDRFVEYWFTYPASCADRTWWKARNLWRVLPGHNRRVRRSRETPQLRAAPLPYGAFSALKTMNQGK